MIEKVEFYNSPQMASVVPSSWTLAHVKSDSMQKGKPETSESV